MRRRPGILALVLASALALAWPAAAAAADPAEARGRSVLVANGSTGEVLYERNADQRLPVASITKVMTALVALEHVRPDELVTVEGAAPAVGESTIYLQPGEQLPARDLLAAALVQSANDAAYALADHVGGDVDAFVGLMNAKAQSLGLDNTRYVRPDGLDVPGHYSSARDTLRLARRAMRLPLFRELVRLRTATIAGGRTLETWNDLLGAFPGTIGVKTGHTAGALWSQVAAARRDGITIYAVILGSPTRARRNRDLARLLRWGFDQYRRVSLVSPGAEYARAAVPFSDERTPLVALDGAEAIVRTGRPLRQVVVAPALVRAPLEPGARVGEVRVYAGRRLLARRPLVSLEGVPEPSLVEEVGWYAERALDHAGGMLETVLGAIF